MVASRSILALLLISSLSPYSARAQAVTKPAQTTSPGQTGQTIRKRRVPVDAQGYSQAVARAEAAIDRKDYAAAEQSLREAIHQDPNSHRAWFDLGFVLNATGRSTDAIEAYRKSVAAKADVFESNLNLGLLLARAGAADAEKYLRAATALKPTAHVEEGQARAWLSLGRVLEKEDPKGAAAALRRAAELQPKDPEPRLSLALLAERQADLPIAETEFKAAAQLDPKSSEALAGLITVYAKTSRFAEAEQALRRYLSLEPQSAAAHIQLGRILAAQDKFEEATAELETALKWAPGDRQGERELAALLLKANQYDKAAVRYRALVEKDPGDAQLRHQLGLVLLKQRLFAAAQAELLQAVRLKPDLATAYGDLALAAHENKDYPLALKALNERAKYLPELPATYFLRATAYDHLRDFKQAAAYYHQFLLAANGQFPDQEWQARHRLIAIEPKK